MFSARLKGRGGEKMRVVALLACGLALSACASITRGWNEQIQFSSNPPEANVRSSTGFQCVTPCTLQIGRKDEFSVVFSKAGYISQEVSVRTQVAGAGAAGFAGNVLARRRHRHGGGRGERSHSGALPQSGRRNAAARRQQGAARQSRGALPAAGRSGGLCCDARSGQLRRGDLPDPARSIVPQSCVGSTTSARRPMSASARRIFSRS